MEFLRSMARFGASMQTHSILWPSDTWFFPFFYSSSYECIIWFWEVFFLPTTVTAGCIVVMSTWLLLSMFFLNKMLNRLEWILFDVDMIPTIVGSVCSGKECWNHSCRRPDFYHCPFPVERMLVKFRVPKALSVIRACE